MTGPLPLLLVVAAPFLTDPSADTRPGPEPDWRVWVRGLSNDDVRHRHSGFFPEWGLTFDLDPGVKGFEENHTFRRWRNLPPADAVALIEALRAGLHDPDKFAAAHLGLWKLYAPADWRRLRSGLGLLAGLEVELLPPAPDGEDWPPDPQRVAFPHPHRQMARLRRWWDEYFRGERTVFFVPGEDRPPAGPEFYESFEDEDLAVASVYHRTLPPKPDDFDTMTVRELEAYYGAPPVVPDGFDFYASLPPGGVGPDMPPLPFSPPPVPDWRQRAGLPPAAGEAANEAPDE